MSVDCDCPEIKNVEDACRWMESIIKKGVLNGITIKATDNINRSDEGSQSKEWCDPQENELRGIWNYIFSHEINHLAIHGTYKRAFIVIGVTLDDMTVRITTSMENRKIIEKYRNYCKKITDYDQGAHGKPWASF